MTSDELMTALGQAAAKVWGQLPAYVQHDLFEAAVRMKELNVGSLPVCENDRLVGMVTDRDMTVRATAAGADPNDARVRDAMTAGIHFFASRIRTWPRRPG